MLVEQIMNQPPITCHPGDTADVAVRLMGEHDCGVIPVVDEREKLIGIVTDRDICMTAHAERSPVHTIRVRAAMTESVSTCRPTDSLDTAIEQMRKARVHRLPVVDASNRVVGILSTNDVFRQVSTHRSQVSLSDKRLVETLAAICEPHRPLQVVGPTT